MDASLAVSLVALAFAGISAGIAGISAWYSHGQLNLNERRNRRDYEATVVIELVSHVMHRRDRVTYELLVTNAGPAVARDVSIELVEPNQRSDWDDEASMFVVLGGAAVAPAMVPHEQRRVKLEQATGSSEDTVAFEFHVSYWDDNGPRTGESWVRVRRR